MKRGPADYLKLGDFNAYCDVCGQKHKGSQLRKRWDGMMVCSKDYEERHQQDFIRAVRDGQPPPFTRPGGDNYITVAPVDFQNDL